MEKQIFLEAFNSEPYPTTVTQRGMSEIIFDFDDEKGFGFRFKFDKKPEFGRNVYIARLGQKTPSLSTYKRVIGKFNNPQRTIATILDIMKNIKDNYKTVHGVIMVLPQDSLGAYSRLVKTIINRELRTELTAEDIDISDAEFERLGLKGIITTIKPYQFKSTYNGKSFLELTAKNDLAGNGSTPADDINSKTNTQQTNTMQHEPTDADNRYYEISASKNIVTFKYLGNDILSNGVQLRTKILSAIQTTKAFFKEVDTTGNEYVNGIIFDPKTLMITIKSNSPAVLKSVSHNLYHLLKDKGYAVDDKAIDEIKIPQVDPNDSQIKITFESGVFEITAKDNKTLSSVMKSIDNFQTKYSLTPDRDALFSFNKNEKRIVLGSKYEDQNNEILKDLENVLGVKVNVSNKIDTSSKPNTKTDDRIEMSAGYTSGNRYSMKFEKSALYITDPREGVVCKLISKNLKDLPVSSENNVELHINGANFKKGVYRNIKVETETSSDYTVITVIGEEKICRIEIPVKEATGQSIKPEDKFSGANTVVAIEANNGNSKFRLVFDNDGASLKNLNFRGDWVTAKLSDLGMPFAQYFEDTDLEAVKTKDVVSSLQMLLPKASLTVLYDKRVEVQMNAFTTKDGIDVNYTSGVMTILEPRFKGKNLAVLVKTPALSAIDNNRFKVNDAEDATSYMKKLDLEKQIKDRVLEQLNDVIFDYDDINIKFNGKYKFSNENATIFIDQDANINVDGSVFATDENFLIMNRPLLVKSLRTLFGNQQKSKTSSGIKSGALMRFDIKDASGNVSTLTVNTIPEKPVVILRSSNNTSLKLANIGFGINSAVANGDAAKEAFIKKVVIERGTVSGIKSFLFDIGLNVVNAYDDTANYDAGNNQPVVKKEPVPETKPQTEYSYPGIDAFTMNQAISALEKPDSPIVIAVARMPDSTTALILFNDETGRILNLENRNKIYDWVGQVGNGIMLPADVKKETASAMRKAIMKKARFSIGYVDIQQVKTILNPERYVINAYEDLSVLSKNIPEGVKSTVRNLLKTNTEVLVIKRAVGGNAYYYILGKDTNEAYSADKSSSSIVNTPKYAIYEAFKNAKAGRSNWNFDLTTTVTFAVREYAIVNQNSLNESIKEDLTGIVKDKPVKGKKFEKVQKKAIEKVLRENGMYHANFKYGDSSFAVSINESAVEIAATTGNIEYLQRFLQVELGTELYYDAATNSLKIDFDVTDLVDS